MCEVMWSRLTVITRQPSQRQASDRLFVLFRPTWASHKWAYKVSAELNISVQLSHLHFSVSDSKEGFARESISCDDVEDAGLTADRGEALKVKGDADGEALKGFMSLGVFTAETGGDITDWGMT